jgi:hypothetical protein
LRIPTPHEKYSATVGISGFGVLYGLKLGKIISRVTVSEEVRIEADDQGIRGIQELP